MDRKDLMKARRSVPDLSQRWQQRRHLMHLRLEEAWTKLDSSDGDSSATVKRAAPSLYTSIVRTDRVISFLDRALVHLDDIERGTHHVESMPIRPASSNAMNLE